MSYFDGVVIAVPTANKQRFIDHAMRSDAVFKEQGATRIVEAWGDDVPKGKITDFQGAVQAREDETVVFTWIEWPDKATRDAAMGKIEALMSSDPRFDSEQNPVPFDGQRMIYGGFSGLLDDASHGNPGYIDGYILPVHHDNRASYEALAARNAPICREYGAIRVVEAWGDDVPEGKVTDFRRSVKAVDGETVVFSFVEWPDKATRDEAWSKIMQDERMTSSGDEPPFDGQRIFWGGFEPVVHIA